MDNYHFKHQAPVTRGFLFVGWWVDFGKGFRYEEYITNHIIFINRVLSNQSECQ